MVESTLTGATWVLTPTLLLIVVNLGSLFTAAGFSLLLGNIKPSLIRNTLLELENPAGSDHETLAQSNFMSRESVGPFKFENTGRSYLHPPIFLSAPTPPEFRSKSPLSLPTLPET